MAITAVDSARYSACRIRAWVVVGRYGPGRRHQSLLKRCRAWFLRRRYTAQDPGLVPTKSPRNPPDALTT